VKRAFGVNGSHVFSAGKYPELKKYPWNILPMCPQCHTDGTKPFEALSTPERLKYLAKNYSKLETGKIYQYAKLLWLKKREDFIEYENGV